MERNTTAKMRYLLENGRAVHRHKFSRLQTTTQKGCVREAADDDITCELYFRNGRWTYTLRMKLSVVPVRPLQCCEGRPQKRRKKSER